MFTTDHTLSLAPNVGGTHTHTHTHAHLLTHIIHIHTLLQGRSDV
jgi:hypothetical protein